MESATPTVPPPRPNTMNSSLRRNIRAIQQRRRHEAARAKPEERIADAITRFTGSMLFVYLHLMIFGAWIAENLLPGLPHFDPSFVILAMAASVEAIFLSTFVLISQNRMTAAADERADLDLQINLLAEHELTKLAQLVAAIADRLGIDSDADPEVDEITKDVAPETVLDEIRAEQEGG